MSSYHVGLLLPQPIQHWLPQGFNPHYCPPPPLESRGLAPFSDQKSLVTCQFAFIRHFTLFD